MAKQFVVWVSYGVRVDVPDDFDATTDAGYDQLRNWGVAEMFSHGQAEVSASCEIEVEDISHEFQEGN